MAEANSAAIVVLLTAGSQEEASRLAEMLVGAHLAACVQIMPQMESVYRWKGEVHRAPEFLLLAKTTAACFDELEREVRALHTYDTVLTSGLAGIIPRGDELLLMDMENATPTVTYINLTTCDSRTEDFGGPNHGAADQNSSGGKPSSRGKQATPMAGLPVGMPGKDADKPLDPAKVAEQAQHLAFPARIALPAVLANSLNQERALSELNDQPRQQGSSVAKNAQPPEQFMLIPTKDGFLEFSERMVEAKFVQRNAMKGPPQKSALEGPVTVAQTADVANEIKRLISESSPPSAQAAPESEKAYRFAASLDLVRGCAAR